MNLHHSSFSIFTVKLTVLLTLIIVSINANASVYTNNINVTYSEHDFSLNVEDNGYLQIESRELSFFQENNDPGLPYFAVDVAIPETHSYITSSISYEKRLLKRDVQIAPAPIPVSTGTNLHNIKSDNVIYYDTTAIYPLSNCNFVAKSNCKDVTILHFHSCPFIYDANEKNLYFIDSLNLEIQISDNPESKCKRASVDSQIIKNIVINSEDIDLHDKNMSSQLSMTNKELDYVIITNNYLKSSFEPLIQWKRSKGLYSEILSIENIISTYPGKDIQSKLKNCLYELYSQYSLKYVLLGGDDTIIPVRGCYGIVNDITEDKTIPTDMYYACFGGNFEWDANNNGIYGETADNINMVQSIYVTRLPVRKTDEVEAFITKLLRYEQNPIWLNKILMAGNKLWDMIPASTQSDAEAKGDNLYETYIQPYWTGEKYKLYDTNTDFIEGKDYDFNPINLFEQLSRGYTFADIATHGKQTSWETESGEDYEIYHANLQFNISNTIITTMSCLTNAFDNSVKGGQEDPCLSECLIRSPQSGVIAYLGCSRQGWDSRLSRNLGASFSYEARFYQNLFSSSLKEKNFGAIVAAAKMSLISSSLENGSYRWVQFGLNPIGDPEMPIFTEEPQEFNKVTFTPCNNAIQIDTGISNCRICAMSMGDGGNSYYKVYNNSQQVNLVDLPDNCSICITKHGYIPKQFSIRLIQNEIINGTTDIINDVVKLGSNITSTKPKGPVIIQEGEITINASSIIINSGTKIEKGAKVVLNGKRQN